MAWRLSWEADVLIALLIFWIVCLILLLIIPRNRKPSSATAWLLLMYIIPVVGSSNLDMRSFHLNLEVTLICNDSQAVADLRPIEESYIRKSKQLHLEEGKARSVSNIFFENVARLTSALQ